MSSLHPRTIRTRAAILDAAWKLIVERGLDVGMAEIAGEVGMTRQSLYVHFKTRGGLLIALVRRADELEDIHARFRGALATEGPVERLDAFLRVWFSFVPVIYPVARQLIAARQQDPEAGRAWNDRMDELHYGFSLLTRRLKRDAALAKEWTAPRAADFLWAGASLPAWEALAIDRDWGAAKTGKTLRRTLASAILV